MNRTRQQDLENRFSRNGGQIVYAHDLNGNFTFLNRAAEQLLGYSCEEARHLNIGKLVAPEISPQLCDDMINSATRRVGMVYEIEIIGKDGRRVPLEVSTRLRFDRGKPVEIEAIAVPTSCQSAASIRARCLDEDFCYCV
jgi:two-component system response regulator